MKLKTGMFGSMEIMEWVDRMFYCIMYKILKNKKIIQVLSAFLPVPLGMLSEHPLVVIDSSEATTH